MKYLVGLFIVLVFPICLLGSIHETLPSWHWAYRYIDDLRLRGCFQELYTMNRPYTRHQVAGALVDTKAQLGKGELFLTSSDLKLLDRLKKEFTVEINRIESNLTSGSYLYGGVRLQGDMDKPDDGKANYRGIYRTELKAFVGRYLTLYNGLSFDQYAVNDPNYMGKKWAGIASYSEQAYAAVGVGPFFFKFGRDFLKWGNGASGTFLFSDVSRPLDQLLGSVKIGPIKFTFLTSALDDINLESLGNNIAKRYVSAHRVDVNLFHGRLQAAITDAVLFGGVNRQLDWVYLNPFLPYHLANANGHGPANTMGSIDLKYFPIRQWECYGSLLIDDIQVEKKIPGDLEPNEIGWMLGSRYADPFGVQGLTVSGEYVRVTNRTYKTSESWETFIHRNQPLGHPLGNDFDHWQVGASKWFLGNLWCQVMVSQTRKGEGSLFTPFDTPWMDYTVEEGYSEPFPTGIVEKGREVSLEVRYYPSVRWGVEGEVHMSRWENYGHVEGVEESGVRWRLGVWWAGGWGVKN